MANYLVLTACTVLVLAGTLGADSIRIQENLRLKQQYLNLFKPITHKSRATGFHIDTSEISRLVPRTGHFSSMDPAHQQAVEKIIEILRSQPTIERAIVAAEQLRIQDEVNLKAWYYAVTAWSFEDPRLKSVPKPSPVDIMPDRFVYAVAMAQAEEIRQLRNNGVKAEECVIIDGEAGADNGRENDVWYWREDIMNNAFHMLYHASHRGNAPVREDRRSETFYFLHRDCIARINAERMANRLPRVETFIWTPGTIIEEGYHPHLNESLTGQPWGSRDPNTPLPNEIDFAGSVTTLENIMIVERRLYEAINTGNLLLPNGSLYPIDNKEGVDPLGDALEANRWSVNSGYYEVGMSIHPAIHFAIGSAERPVGEPREPAGVMLDVSVSFRDPTFWRWHKYVDDLYDANKQLLRPYTPTGGELPLVWSGVTVTEVAVQPNIGSPSTNQLSTFFGERRFELSRGLDFRGDFEEGEVDVCVKHLDHEDFVYKIVVNSENLFTRPATVRLFLSSRGDHTDRRWTMREQRDMMFTLDVFQATLKPGQNVIYRAANASSATIPWHQTLNQLENATDDTAICGCGFPQHLQIPRGRPEGMVFDLVALVTNFVDDAVDYEEPFCKSAYLYCGISGTKYPDAKPMGYPFDRLPYHVDANGNPTENGTPVRDLDEYVRHVPNIATTQVTITHMGDRTGRAKLLKM